MLGCGRFEGYLMAYSSDIFPRGVAQWLCDDCRSQLLIKSGVLKAAACLPAVWRAGLSLSGHFCFEWVTNRCWCLPEERRTVSPRCGLFAFCSLIRARVHLGLHTPPPKENSSTQGQDVFPYPGMKKLIRCKKNWIIFDLSRLSMSGNK